ncbi:MFS general substrate transporter [Meira miltonrushii]|uniref:MFS general substrate transporter n=1 Tax=Meira miltonrushii TaxID=1280837 RepID=A0A316V5N3_9BASI|nr:MFS general substrate transporter [Meira miltonrushii]PWN31533.1 MFS general substrate transporter [Meira miltonrushii]
MVLPRLDSEHYKEEVKMDSETPKECLASDSTKTQEDVSAELDAIATQPSVYDDEEYAKFNKPHPEWENIHRFDPKFRWTWREEKKLVKKMDWRIALWAVVMFFCLDLDRENIAQANSDNMLEDLRLTQADYNLGNTLFKLAFLLAELPSQMISKRLGPDRWVPAQITLWSIFSGAQFFMKGRSSFLAFRWMIGMLQGGFIPDIVLYLSYFYTRTELPMRLAFFWVSNYLVKIVSPFLALGLLRLRGASGHAGWRYLFLIEGLITLIVGVFSFIQMPAGPTQTKNWFYRNGWFSVEEEKLIVNRAIRDDPSKADMHNRQGIDWQGFKKSLSDYDLWPMYLIGLIFLLPCYPIANYLTIQLRKFGFTVEATNALSIPAPVLGLLLLILITMISERVKYRIFVASSIAVWNAIFLFTLFGLPANASKWTYWAIASLQQAYPYVHALQVALVSRQAGSVRTRTISAAIYNITVQISAIIGANVYQASDAPLYRKGNLSIAILSCATFVIYIGVYFYYKTRNQQRDKKWNAMSREEQLQYLATTKDEGNRRLDFRFAI